MLLAALLYLLQVFLLLRIVDGELDSLLTTDADFRCSSARLRCSTVFDLSRQASRIGTYGWSSSSHGHLSHYDHFAVARTCLSRQRDEGSANDRNEVSPLGSPISRDSRKIAG